MVELINPTIDELLSVMTPQQIKKHKLKLILKELSDEILFSGYSLEGYLFRNILETYQGEKGTGIILKNKDLIVARGHLSDMGEKQKIDLLVYPYDNLNFDLLHYQSALIAFGNFLNIHGIKNSRVDIRGSNKHDVTKMSESLRGTFKYTGFSYAGPIPEFETQVFYKGKQPVLERLFLSTDS